MVRKILSSYRESIDYCIYYNLSLIIVEIKRKFLPLLLSVLGKNQNKTVYG